MRRAERILKCLMVSAGISAFLFGHAAMTGQQLVDANPTHYVSSFHNPFAERPATGHFDVSLPKN